jgi:Trk K+ transport system NAD-binding subunit
VTESVRPTTAATAQPETTRHWAGHVIVCGLQPVGLRTIGQLRQAGARVVVLDDEHVSERAARSVREWGVPIVARGASLSDSLFAAGVAGAEAVICIESSDLRTLETILLVRDLRADVRLVAQLDNPAVANATQEISGAAAVIDVAALFAPAVVEACSRRWAHDITLGAVTFSTVEATATRTGTLRELYGTLVPLGVTGEADHNPVLCPGRDLPVRPGDQVTLLGTTDELHLAGLRAGAEERDDAVGLGRRAVRAVRRAIGELRNEAERSLRVAVVAGVALLVLSTLLLHFGYHLAGGGQHLSVVSAAYFTVETVATVGFGDFSFSGQAEWLEIYGILLILAGTTLVTTILALLTNALVTRRIAQSLGQARIPGMRDHVVMVGLGSVGMQVLDGLLARGHEVVVVEREESNRYLNQVRQRGVPLVLGDSTLAQTLDSVNLHGAASVAIVTSDDLTNIETGWPSAIASASAGLRCRSCCAYSIASSAAGSSRASTSATCGRRRRSPRPGSSAPRSGWRSGRASTSGGSRS